MKCSRSSSSSRVFFSWHVEHGAVSVFLPDSGDLSKARGIALLDHAMHLPLRGATSAFERKWLQNIDINIQGLSY